MSASPQRQSLVDSVYEHLKKQLAAPEMEIGQRVSVQKVAADCQVSRSTVYKVLDRLVSDGLVDSDDSGHYIVSARSSTLKVFEPLAFEFSNQTESTYDQLLERLLQGEFAPGEVLKERRLANDFGVNPSTIRRAAEWLSREGFLEPLPRRGWRVILLAQSDIQDSYDIRLSLEPLCVEKSVERISPEDLVSLEQQTERIIEIGQKASLHDRREADYNFHKVICLASQSKALSGALLPVIRQVLLVTTTGFRFSHARTTRSFIEHRRVLEAMMRRDKKGAVRHMKSHLRNAQKFYLETPAV